DDESGTAICPYCDIDTIIGECSEYPIEPNFLMQMYYKWFIARAADEESDRTCAYQKWLASSEAEGMRKSY
ncbi:MAG: hypothetical protein Q4G11_06970, partial [Gallicola sp.]|nr:hypothetical protein [Gallicola sp.]